MDTILHPCEAGNGDYCAALKQLLLVFNIFRRDLVIHVLMK